MLVSRRATANQLKQRMVLKDDVFVVLFFSGLVMNLKKKSGWFLVGRKNPSGSFFYFITTLQGDKVVC